MKNYENSEELWHEKWKIMTILNIGDYSEHSWQLLPIKTYDKCDTSIVNILTNRHKFEIETISNTIEIYFKPFKFQVYEINVASRGIQWLLPNCKKSCALHILDVICACPSEVITRDGQLRQKEDEVQEWWREESKHWRVFGQIGTCRGGLLCSRFGRRRHFKCPVSPQNNHHIVVSKTW